MLGAITLSAIALSAYAVLTKVFPGALNPDEIYARLREPFGYWNSVGLAAALGVPGCLWLGARRAGHQALNALAYPALGLLVLTMLLSFSRGALLAAVLGAAFWFATVPLRLRGAAVLIAGAAGGGLDGAVGVLAGRADRRPRAGRPAQPGRPAARPARARHARAAAAAGLAVGFARAAHTPTLHQRDRAGVALLVALALVPVGAVVALSLGDRGLTGSISARWNSAHERRGAAAAQRQRPPHRGRQRPRALLGRGAEDLRGPPGRRRRRGRLRDRPQALPHRRPGGAPRPRLRRADARRPRPRRPRGEPRAARRVAGRRGARHRPAPPPTAGGRTTPERIGLLTLVAVVVVFGVHSFVDWTWFVPGQRRRRAAGRRLGGRPRPARARARRRARRPPPRPRAPACASACAPAPASGCAPSARAPRCCSCVAGAWAVWQPARADSLTQDALDTLDRGDADAARTQAQQRPRRQPALARPAVHARDDRDGGRPQPRGPRRVGGCGAPAARQPRPVATTRRVRVEYAPAAGRRPAGDPPGAVPRPPIF